MAPVEFSLVLSDNKPVKLMRKYERGSWIALGLLAALFMLPEVKPASANTSRSPSFEVSETEFGAGAALETCSGSYCAQATIGSTSAEQLSSPSFTAAFGTESSDSEPMLEVMVEPGQSDLGVLSVEETAFRTMMLHVRSHLAGGYQVQVTGQPPSYGDHILASPRAPTASSPGTEQFAINAVANETPRVGEDPAFSSPGGVVADVILPNYAGADLFAYSDGDVIARTSSESSQIRYTISMIVNVSGSTPAGHYSGDLAAIVTPVF